MNPSLLREAHVYYMKAKSLNKTCAWLGREKGVHITRNKLSSQFHLAGLRVLAPNGKAELYYGGDVSRWRSPEAKLAAQFIEAMWKDLREGGRLIDRMSAAWALNGDTYKIMLAVLIGDVEVSPSIYEAIPGDVDSAEVDRLINLYRICNMAWVEHEDTPN